MHMNRIGILTHESCIKILFILSRRFSSAFIISAIHLCTPHVLSPHDASPVMHFRLTRNEALLFHLDDTNLHFNCYLVIIGIEESD